MMLAEGVKFDVFDQNDLARLGIKDRVVDDFFDALAIALSEKLRCARGARGSLYQPLTIGVFADGVEQITVNFR